MELHPPESVWKRDIPPIYYNSQKVSGPDLQTNPSTKIYCGYDL